MSREDKQALRIRCRQLRDSIPKEDRKKPDELIFRNIVSWEGFQNADTVLIYMPIGSEINLLPIFMLCKKTGKEVGFPLIDKATDTMEFRSPEQLSDSVRGAYGIPEPPKTAGLCRLTPQTLCILPGLSFDRSGGRLGYGKGYYDRFLEQFPGVTLGAVYEQLMCDRVPTDPHDKPVSYLVHEHGLFPCKEEYTAELQEASDTENDTRPQSFQSGMGRSDTRTQSSSSPEADPESSPVSGQNSGWLTSVKAFASRTSERLFAPVKRLIHRKLHSGSDSSPKEAKAADSGFSRHAPPILVLCTYVLLLLSGFIDRELVRRGSEYIGVILLQIFIFFVPAVLYIQLRGEQFPTRIRMKPIRKSHLWFCFCCLPVMICGSLLLNILTGGIESLDGNFTLYNTFVAHLGGSFFETVYVILSYGVLPAFCEELVFRSLLCAEYERYGVGVSITVSAFFFAMLHFSFPFFPNYFMLGALLAGVMYATRSILAPMLLHLCYNLFCLFGQPYLSNFYITAGSSEIFIFCLVVLFLLFSAFAAGEAGKIYYRYAKANLPSDYTVPVSLKQYPKQIFKAVASPVTAVLTVLFLVMATVGLFR